MPSPRNAPERIICAAVFVETGEAHPPRMSYGYPKTGLVFAGWRHGDCMMLASAWWELQSDEERGRLRVVNGGDYARHQGFLTSKGRYLSRPEALEVARACGQVDGIIGGVLTSEDLY